MSKLDTLKKHLKEGEVYRRADLSKWSKSVDRHLAALVKDGTLQKLSQGLYHVPKPTVFGNSPPEETHLVRSFLKDNRFLLTSPNIYNSLGLGTTQLYNQRIVYNQKRHGEFKLGNRNFSFRKKFNFPKVLTEEFLVVDLVNNLDQLAEEKETVLQNLSAKVQKMDPKKLSRAIADYGSTRAQKIFGPLITPKQK